MASSSAVLLCALLLATSGAALAAKFGGTATATSYETQALIDYPGNSSAIGSYAPLSNGDAIAEFENGSLPIAVTDYALKWGAHYTLPQFFATYSFYVAGPVSSTIKLTALQVIEIYNGTITDWSQIPYNGGLTGPITPVARGDKSASTDTVTRWLKASFSGFPSSQVGFGPWLTGYPGVLYYNSIFAVATSINLSPGGIGYLPSPLGSEVFGLTEVAVQNRIGKFVVQSGKNALNNVVPHSLPAADGDWTGVSLINQPGAKTYPISQFVYINTLETYVAPADGADLVSFLNYLFDNQTQTLAYTFSFNPIPLWLRAQNLLAISNIAY